MTGSLFSIMGADSGERWEVPIFRQGSIRLPTKEYSVSFDVSDLGLHQRLGHLLASVGSPRFWPALAAFLNDAVPIDSWVSMVFRSGAPPVVLHQGHNNRAQTGLFFRYVRELYVLDPFYSFSLTFERPGAPMPGLY